MTSVPHADAYLALLRELAANSRNVLWTATALEQMGTTGIAARMAMNVLKLGMVEGEIVAGRSAGEWQAKIRLAARGRPAIRVQVTIIGDSRVAVNLVEWVDRN